MSNVTDSNGKRSRSLLLLWLSPQESASGSYLALVRLDSLI